MAIPLYQVDAFTERPFAGNPAAVVLLPEPREDSWLQSMAQEMNLAETAFLLPEGAGYRLRWFTPTVEVELCGHATLASAHALWSSGRLPRDKPIAFFTRSGTLSARSDGAWIELDFPATPAEPAEAPPGLEEALGVPLRSVARSRFDFLVEIGSEKELRGLKPDQARLGTFPVRGVIVTCRGEGGPYDFLSRFFAPASGIPEDPVTGSAHCTLGPYWSGRLGKREFLAYQASPRGGVVRVRLEGERVRLGGQAVTVLQGDLL